jgi:nitrite reductase/ring-hydroxylating ferredoxin subunit
VNAGPRLVGRVPRASLDHGAIQRLAYPPFDVLVALVHGEPTAIEDACNHAGASLSEGERQGNFIGCPMHGYVFDLRTGHLIAPRGLCNNQRWFHAVFDGDDVVVWDPGPPATVVVGPSPAATPAAIARPGPDPAALALALKRARQNE